MYSKGMSQRDIEDNLREIYGADVSQALIPKITDKILPEVQEWQTRPLDSTYPIVYFDGIVFKSRKDHQIINKCVYSVLGVDLDGHKDILGLWISENEGASFYAPICSGLKKRGVSDIFIACHDNLKGLGVQPVFDIFRGSDGGVRPRGLCPTCVQLMDKAPNLVI
jgi:putative transposase